MPTALKVSSCRNDSGSVATNDHLPLLGSCRINEVQGCSAANRQDTADVLPADFERFGKRNVPEVTRPEKQRALRGRSSQKVVSGCLDGDSQIVLSGEFDPDLNNDTRVRCIAAVDRKSQPECLQQTRRL